MAHYRALRRHRLPDTRVRWQVRSRTPRPGGSGGRRNRRGGARGRGHRRGRGTPSRPSSGARTGDLPRRLAPRRQLGTRLAAARNEGRRRVHVRRPDDAQLLRRARGRRDQRARARDPRDVRDQRGNDRLHQHRVGRVLRARRGADGLARGPRAAGADRRGLEPAVRLLRLPVRACGERVHVVLDAVLHRDRQGQHDSGAPVTDGRQLPDRRPRADVGAQQHDRARTRPREPGAGRRAGGVGRRSRGLALGVDRARGAGLDRRRRGVLHARATARSVREG